jgi:hypothetical protein
VNEELVTFALNVKEISGNITMMENAAQELVDVGVRYFVVPFDETVLFFFFFSDSFFRFFSGSLSFVRRDGLDGFRGGFRRV